MGRETETEGCSSSLHRDTLNCAAQKVAEEGNKAQPKPCALGIFINHIFATEELAEKLELLVFGDAIA